MKQAYFTKNSSIKASSYLYLSVFCRGNQDKEHHYLPGKFSCILRRAEFLNV